jgi:acetoin utilization deacetylase AcuC-like enzyme/GNAT superfamily N-acetyltransferase
MDRLALDKAIALLKKLFPLADSEKFDEIEEVLNNPLKYNFKLIVLVADDNVGSLRGVATLFYAPDLRFCFLDFIATEQNKASMGVGSALYQRVREEALALDCIGVFFECLPDDPALCPDEMILGENRARLKFYERFGAYPIVNTKYETPVKEGETCAPYLVFDNLGNDNLLQTQEAQSIARAILERKYGDYCPPSYIQMVVDSFQDDPIQLRKPLYVKKPIPLKVTGEIKHKIGLCINTLHNIHHVRTRGYVESPVRISVIFEEIHKLQIFNILPISTYPDRIITETHNKQLFNYLKTVCENLSSTKAVYPYVFPIRNGLKPPKDRTVAAGYYCIDTFTPLTSNSFKAARRAVDCALTAADYVLSTRTIAYALVRPPGHHAERKVFGGFCYFNSAAIASNVLSKYGKVAMLDIDFHHGNGQQDIFYNRADVLTISIHGHPSFAYPYFSGFRDEKGEAEGQGFNINYPLPETITAEQYLKTVNIACRDIRNYKPQFLTICLGLDTAKGDPTGTWPLKAIDFEANGKLIGSLKIPTLIVQEGGYNQRNMGINAAHFFKGFYQSFFERP